MSDLMNTQPGLIPSLPNNMHSQQSGIKSFIPWIIILVILAIFDFMKVLPKTMEWIDAQKQTKSITKEIDQLTILLEGNKEKKSDIQSKFDTESKDYLLKEAQIFPKKFSAYDVSKIFELFSIQHSILSTDSSLRIESISFSGGDSGKIETTLNLICTEDTLKRVIEYLQSGNLPEDFAKNEGLFAIDLEYLRSHKLPIAHIKSIRISGKESEGAKLKRVTLGISFFVQN